MILTDREIQSAIETGQITIDPNPAADSFSSTSVDLRLSAKARSWKQQPTGADLVLDPGVPGFSFAQVHSQYTDEVDLSTNTFKLEPRQFLLAWTIETVKLPSHSRIAARVEGKSSLARLGVCVHVTAPTIHAGFSGTIQLEMVNHGSLPVRLRPGMKICQLIFEQTLGTPQRGYVGQFQSQTTSGFSKPPA